MNNNKLVDELEIKKDIITGYIKVSCIYNVFTDKIVKDDSIINDKECIPLKFTHPKYVISSQYVFNFINMVLSASNEKLESSLYPIQQDVKINDSDKKIIEELISTRENTQNHLK